jgi:cyclopropane fatty-acyl-phospholipid synthase-like methyltransferase
VTTADDVDFWLGEAARTDGPLLELGCGTGRVTIPLAARGCQITGLDISDSMLRRARSKAADAGVVATWILGDMRGFELDRQFAMIFCPFGTFNHLRRDDVAQCLSAAREHLLPGGHFALDTFNSSDSDNALCDDVQGFSSFTRSETEEFLASSGFDVAALYGDYDRSEYSKDSKRLILKAGVI